MGSAATTTRPETPEAKKKRQKRAARPVYMEWRRMVDEQTGELRLALVAGSGIDKFLCSERGYRSGDQVRCEIKKPRNVKLHRLVHGLGKLVGQNRDLRAA